MSGCIYLFYFTHTHKKQQKNPPPKLRRSKCEPQPREMAAGGAVHPCHWDGYRTQHCFAAARGCGSSFFPTCPKVFPLPWDGIILGVGELPASLRWGFPEVLLRGLCALLKMSLFSDVCYCNLCMMLSPIENRGLYLRGNYACINTAPSRSACAHCSVMKAVSCKSFPVTCRTPLLRCSLQANCWLYGRVTRVLSYS